MSEKRNGHATGPRRVQNPLFFEGQHGACFIAPESENMEVREYTETSQGGSVCTAPLCMEKVHADLRNSIDGEMIG